ncbi:hypothetical protein ACFXPA_24525 [Amycolatopsis sp. NPDC059090]|uniref:hypothetical protein n=1 Tax=unclassified Amycolatopsis TaxID=2618356 RepID=UPI0036725037
MNFDASATCEAYGAVKKYLAAHPCSDLRRGLFEASESGSKMVVATATVTMPTTEQAEGLRALADRPGTGNITELSTGFDGQHYTSRAAGNTVTITQAKAQLLAHPSSAALDHAASARFPESSGD